MKLKIILPLKKININGKELVIPKLGLNYYEKLKEAKSPEETLKIVLDSVDKNLSFKEAHLVLLHLAEFNGKCNDTFEYNNKIYSINDVYILPTPKFTYQGKEYKFRDILPGEKFSTAKELLETLSLEKVDFGSMPAFVYKWADELGKSIAINLDDKVVYGDDILGLFQNENT